MTRALIEAAAILSAMTVFLVLAMHQRAPTRDPISPDFHLAQRN